MQSEQWHADRAGGRRGLYSDRKHAQLCPVPALHLGSLTRLLCPAITRHAPCCHALQATYYAEVPEDAAAKVGGTTGLM